MTHKQKVYFRSLDELENTEEFRSFLHKEFPAGVEELKDPVSRRDFMSLMGASIGLAGFGSGCFRRPEAHIVPYSKRPEEVIPGLPNYYASTLSYSGNVVGVVVEAHEGRPTKIEGNSLHPASEGGACSIEQSAILSVYDPDRVTSVWQGNQPVAASAFDTFLAARLAELQGRQGQGFYVLHQQNSSPAFQAQVQKLRAAYPQAQVLEYEPLSDAELRAGTRLAYGQPLLPVYRANADVILCVDDDLLGQGPFHLRYARDFAQRHDPENASSETPMGRMWVAEPTMTVTGATADHRVRIRASEVGPFLRVLAARLQTAGVELPPGMAASGDGGFPARFMTVLAADLAANRRKSLVSVGKHHPAEVQALAHAINSALGNVGQTVAYGRPLDPERAPHVEQIRQLTAALDAGQVDTLVILGGNPVFDAPADLGFAEKLGKAKHVIHHSLYRDETGVLAGWVVPQAHWLESWGDALAWDGTYSLQQPLIEPIWKGATALEMVARLAGNPAPVGRELVHDFFQQAQAGGEVAWDRTLHDGLVAETAGRFVFPQLDAAAVSEAAAKVPESAPPATAQSMELLFVNDRKVWDGRFANNGWLQELPDPISKLSWSNAALMSPATARALGATSRDMVRVEVGGRSLDIPVWEQPGMADNVVAMAVGYGRTVAGRVGDRRGFNTYALRTSDAPTMVKGAKVTPVGGKFPLATTQDHNSMEGRPVVREATLAEYREEPFFAREMVEHPPLVALWKQHELPGQQWGMVIDLNRCVGCNGCMVACQAENNIPIVGPEQIRKGREMYWIRLDRYYASKDPGDPNAEVEVVHQPVTCMQCENAPCENVCPVAATTHSEDGGLNDMVYNRCVGTRYCSNNCPFKVRRFNYFDWHEQGMGPRGHPITLVEKMKFNPDVTVRTRGVMEKCTYCVQRIHAAKRSSKLAGQEKVPDGVIVPACAQACPTEAIVFGDVSDPNSQVSLLKKRSRNYEMLAELNVKPRTSYLAKIRNPHPDMVKA